MMKDTENVVEAYENENGALSFKIKIPEAVADLSKNALLPPIQLQKSRSYTP
jgi:hypothetical protein